MPQNYSAPASNNILETPQEQLFRAKIRAQEYASGGTNNAARAFNIVLLLVFLLNVFVLMYFVLHRGLVTDFSEPPNLFTLAVNSPPSHLMAGSCGGGPEGKHYVVNWFVNTEGDHLYMEPGEKPVHHHRHGPSTPSKGGWFSGITSAIENLRTRGLGWQPAATGKERQLLRPVSVVDDGTGPDVELETQSTRTSKHYYKLANRRSML
jgi:hypothetical protein